MNDILSGYSAASVDLIARFESISSGEVFAPMRDLLPTSPARIADIGAGTGRDAAWFASQGHQVLAVEPVSELRLAGMTLHKDSGVTWLDDRLPELCDARREPPFDLVTMCAVWQHLDDEDRDIAIQRVGQMIADRGLLVMSLRHGVGAPNRCVFPVSVECVVASAKRHGLDVLRATEAASVQASNHAAGVRWTWLALRKADYR